ncbi:hypothetical protein FOL47_000732, partial [Perkinsus chesapeaki]
MVESATSSGYAALTPEEVHHKMCKKIAQLTRVIFHLNSKNEDNQRILQAHLSSYEKRVACLEEEYSKSLKEKEEAMENELAHVLVRVRKAQGDYEKQLASLTDTLRESKDRHERDLKSANKYHKDALEKLESQRVQESEASKKRVASIEEEHAREVKRMDANYKKALSEAREQAANKEAEAERRFESEHLRAKEESEKLQRELQSATVSLKEMKESHEESQRQLRNAKDELSQKTDELAGANRALAQLQGVIKDESTASAEMQKNIERMEAESKRQAIRGLRMRTEISQQESALAGKDAKISELSQKLQGYQAEGNESKQSLAAALTEKTRLQEALTALEGKLRGEERRREVEYKCLEKELESERERVKGIEDEWSRRLESAIANYKAETVELRRGHKDELDALMARHSKKIASLENIIKENSSKLEETRKNTLEAALLSEREKHTTEKAEIIRNYEEKLKLAEQKLLQGESDKNKVVDEMLAENQRLKTELDRTERSDKEMRLRIEGLERSLQEAAEEKERETRRKKEAVEKLKQEFGAELSSRLKAIQDEAAKTEKSVSEKAEVQRKRSEMVLMEQEKRLKQLTAEVEQLNEELRAAQGELVRERQRGEEIIEATRKGEQERSRLLEGHLLEKVTALEEKLSSEHDQWKNQRDKLAIDHQIALEEAENIRKRDVDEARAQEMRRWSEIREKDNVDFAHQLTQKQARHDAAMRCLKAENDSNVKALNEKLESIRKDMEVRVKQADEARRKREGEMQAKLDETRSAVLVLNRKVDEQEREIADKNSELARLSSSFAEEMTTMRERWAKLVTDHQGELQAAMEAHRKEISHITAEKQREIMARDEALRRAESIREAEGLRLNGRIDELVLIYENRPSRE